MKFLSSTVRASAVALCGLSALSGCAAVNTAVTHHHLETSTRMSHTIFLNPVSAGNRTVLVEVGNTSGVSGLPLGRALDRTLRSDGYRIVTNPKRAHYLVQANILKAGKSTEQNASRILGSGFGGAISGGLIGTGAGALTGDSGGAALAGGLAGAAIGYAADMLVKNENYAMVTDIRISERLQHAARERTVARLDQGSRTRSVIERNGTVRWMRYRTRVVSTAQQMNLSFRRAKRALTGNTALSIAGLFGHQG